MTTIEKLKGHRLVYLATPYSKYPGGIGEAFICAAKYAGRLLTAGVKVYSPIAHTHPIACFGELDPLDHSIWLPFDEAMMTAADAICVLQMDTWEISKGIAHEIEFFQNAGKPVYFMKPEELT